MPSPAQGVVRGNSSSRASANWNQPIQAASIVSSGTSIASACQFISSTAPATTRITSRLCSLRSASQASVRRYQALFTIRTSSRTSTPSAIANH